jgi:hypothetical protein
MINPERKERLVRVLKRTVIALIVLLMVFIGVPFSAADGFYCEYVPKSEKSTVFYIDIYSSIPVRAAVMELSYDSSFAEYREVSGVEKTASIRANNDNGTVKIAFAESKAVTGNLCRVALKALKTGTTTFTLHISQAADDAPKLISGLSDSSIEVKFGKDDVVADSSDKASASSGTYKSSSRSSISGAEDDDSQTIREGDFYDYRQNRPPTTYILIGAGIVILIAGLIFAGVLLGRRTMNQKNEPDSEEKQETTLDSETSENEQ